MEAELIIQHGNKVYLPIVEEGIIWSTERAGTPGQLKFGVIPDGIIEFAEGDAVRLCINGYNVFYGFIFSKKRDKNKVIDVTAYDQLRYLKNKDTYVYNNKTVGELLQIIASDFNMQTGNIENTGYKIPYRVEDNVSLFDIIQNALDLTLQNTGKVFVMYDDFGKIALQNIESKLINILIDEETSENYDYTSSIDANTYNKIKLIYENEDSGKRDVYIAQDSGTLNEWGVLQYYETIQKGENGIIKANALLELYNKKSRNLSIKKALGDLRVRAGCMIVVQFDLGDMKIQNWMLVEKCSHEFSNGQHFMDLNLRGGEFNV